MLAAADVIGRFKRSSWNVVQGQRASCPTELTAREALNKQLTIVYMQALGRRQLQVRDKHCKQHNTVAEPAQD
jgi:hypothetical protein